MAKISLYLIDSSKYFDCVMKIIKKETKKTIIYVTTNKPTATIIESFKKNKIDTKHMFFIDCITKHINSTPPKEIANAIYIQNPQSLTAISIAINESIKRLGDEDKIVFIDSLSLLLIYNDANTISQFSNFLLNKMRTLGADATMLAVESDSDKQVIHEISSIVDEVKSC